MQRDKKFGLGLGILLVGVVAAFFFRHEPAARTPELNDPESLDRQIAEREVTPYPEPPHEPAAPVVASGPRDAAWDLPEFLQKDTATSELPAPDPIPVSTSVPVDAPGATPAHNHGWRAPDQLSENEHEPRRAAESGPLDGETADVVLHRVVQGDTLSDLAARYLGSSGRFLEIYEANRDVLRSPNDVRVGLTLRIRARQAASPAAPARGQTVRVSDTQTREAPAGGVPVAPAIQQEPQPEPTPPAAAGRDTAPRLRFQPVRRSPLLPGTRVFNDAASPPTAAGRILTQKPPVDLLPLEDVFDGEEPAAGER